MAYLTKPAPYRVKFVTGGYLSRMFDTREEAQAYAMRLARRLWKEGELYDVEVTLEGLSLDVYRVTYEGYAHEQGIGYHMHDLWRVGR